MPPSIVSPGIVSLGHAGLDIRLGATRLVVDPWLSPGGAYLGSRHPFPRNDQLRAADLHDTPDLFISSPRAEHFDAETLRGFPRSVRVLIPAFPSRALAAALAALGFETVVELAEGEPLDLGNGATATVWLGTPRYEPASTLVLRAAGQVVVVQSDCTLDGAALARVAADKPSIHVLGFSGSSYFPGCYEFPSETMQGHVAVETERLLTRFLSAAQAVGAPFVIPTGPACFLDERGFPLNFGESIFYDVDTLVARVSAEAPALAERLRPLYPGDAIRRHDDDGGWSFDSRRPYDDKRAHLEAYRDARAAARAARLAAIRAEAEPIDAQELVKQLRIYFHNLFRFDDVTWDMDQLIRFQLSDGPSLWLDFRKRPMRSRLDCEEPAQYTITTDTTGITLLLQGKVTWNDLLLGNQVTLRRDPDRASAGLMHHLHAAHDEALFGLVRQLNPELITLEDETHEYVCQKFCPHQGRSLEFAMVERGVLTCTAHGWRFNLKAGGKCLWGGDQPLTVKEIRVRK
jgi:UDP-MurNAc hydroxylase